MSINEFIDYAKNNSKLVTEEQVNSRKRWDKLLNEVRTFMNKVNNGIKTAGVHHSEYDSNFGNMQAGVTGTKFQNNTLYFKSAPKSNLSELHVISNENIVDRFVIKNDDFVSNKTGEKISQRMLENYVKYLMD